MSKRFVLKHVPSHIKKPIRKTDLCSVCEDLHRAKRKESALLKQLRQDHPEEDCHDLRAWARCPRVHVFIRMRCELLNIDLDTLERHKAHALRQKNAFEKLINEINKGNTDAIAIILDYKENWRLPMKRRQLKKEYFEKTPMSCLGFVVYLPKKEPLYFDVLTADIGHGGLEASDGFRMVVEELSKEHKHDWEACGSLEVWSDCGNHFRSCEFAHTVLVEKFEGMKCPPVRTLNFFVEQHGKCRVDSHFGRESQHVRRVVTLGKEIATLDVLHEVLEELEGVKVLRPDRLWAVQGPSRKRMRLEVDGIQSTYCIRTGVEGTGLLKKSRAADKYPIINSGFSDNPRKRGNWVEVRWFERACWFAAPGRVHGTHSRSLRGTVSVRSGSRTV